MDDVEGLNREQREVVYFLRKMLLGPFCGRIVSVAIFRTRREMQGSCPEIVGGLHYGATYLHPEKLVIWYLVQTNDALEEASKNGLEQVLAAKTRRRLARSGYPKDAISDVHISMESQERVDKGEGAWQYFH